MMEFALWMTGSVLTGGMLGFVAGWWAKDKFKDEEPDLPADIW